MARKKMPDVVKLPKKLMELPEEAFIVTAKGRLLLTEEGAKIKTRDGKELADFVVPGDIVIFVDKEGNRVEAPYKGPGYLCVQVRKKRVLN